MSNVLNTDEPESFAEAKDASHSQLAMQEEYESILKNDTWDLINLPSDKKVIRCRWVYKVKYQFDGAIDRYKDRLVAKGYAQIEGVNFEETFILVAKMTTI